MSPLRPVVLVIDDDEAVHDALELVLEDDYEVISAFAGEQGLAEAGCTPCQAWSFSTYSMPKIDGWATFETILEMGGRRPKVIFLTGVDSSAAALGAVRLGAEDWLVKPFEEPALLMQLDALLRPRRVIVRGGELGVRGTVGVLTFVRCGLSAEYAGV